MASNPTESIRMLVVDDHQMFIDGIKSLLRKERDISIVGEALSGAEAIKYLEQNEVDLMMTDISMPEMDGVELTRYVKQHFPEVRVLVLSMYNDRQIIDQIVGAEAEGYVLKNTGKGELISAIRRIADNGTFYSKEVIATMFKQQAKPCSQDAEVQPLSERELEILKLIVAEYSSEQIADKLFISKRTVDSHRKNILAKTKIKTLVGLIKFAIRTGVADIND